MKRILTQAQPYLIAVVITVLAAALQKALWSLLSPLLFFAFYPAVIFAAWSGGFGAGIAATLLSVILVSTIFTPIQNIFSFGHLVQMILFSFLGLIYSFSFEQLNKTRERLKRALKLRGEFLSIASHELKTPLANLRSQLEISDHHAASLKTDTTEIRRELGKGLIQLDKLIQMIDDLLNLERLEAGVLDLRLEEIDVSKLVQDVVERQVELFSRAQVKIETQLAQGLRAKADRSKLERVVVNLLTNALKYGAGKPVTIKSELQGKWILIEIKDQGIGIAPEAMPKIFERFERAVSPMNYPGLGLGLYIARKIMDSHGGKIEVESQTGRGSTFRVWLKSEAATARGRLVGAK